MNPNHRNPMLNELTPDYQNQSLMYTNPPSTENFDEYDLGSSNEFEYGVFSKCNSDDFMPYDKFEPSTSQLQMVPLEGSHCSDSSTSGSNTHTPVSHYSNSSNTNGLSDMANNVFPYPSGSSSGSASSTMKIDLAYLVDNHTRIPNSPSKRKHDTATNQDYNKRPLYSQKEVLNDSDDNDPRYSEFCKAVVQFNSGSVNSMIAFWGVTERQQGRRVVEFRAYTEHKDTTRHINVIAFSYRGLPIRQPPSNVCFVSCIYWPREDSYFITSTDLIRLIAYILGVKFTKEEKNRMRRNLEYLSPMTLFKDINKGKDDIEFTHRVLDYNFPQVKKINKDIKVFRWSALQDAVMKVSKNFVASKSSIVLS